MKNREKESIKVKQEIETPWETKEKEYYENFYARITKERGFDQFELSGDSLKKIKDVVTREKDDLTLEIAKDWLSRHKDEIKNEGLQTSGSENYILKLFHERNGFDELKKLEDAKSVDFKKRLGRLNEIDSDLDNGKDISMGGRNLALLVLENRYKAKTAELNQLSKQPDSNEKNLIENKLKSEVESLFVLRKDLAQSIDGVSLDKQFEPTVLSKIPSKEQYIKDNAPAKQNEIANKKFKDYLSREWQNLSEAEKRRYRNEASFNYARANELFNTVRSLGVPSGVDISSAALALIEKGYRPEKFQQYTDFSLKVKNFFNKIVSGGSAKPEFFVALKDNERLSLTDYGKKLQEIYREFLDELNNESQTSLAYDWENLKQAAIQREIDLKIEEAAQNLTKNLENAHARLREHLLRPIIKDFQRASIKGKKEAEKAFEEKGVDSTKFMADVLQRKGAIGKLSENFDENAENIAKFLNEHGFETNKEELLKMSNELKERYAREVTRQKGFLIWIIDLILDLSNPIQAKQEKK